MPKLDFETLKIETVGRGIFLPKRFQLISINPGKVEILWENSDYELVKVVRDAFIDGYNNGFRDGKNDNS